MKRHRDEDEDTNTQTNCDGNKDKNSKTKESKENKEDSSSLESVAMTPATTAAATAVAAESAPITIDGEMPQKKFYRSRAHCNPLSHNDNFDYPARPDLFNWTESHYPHHPLLQQQQKQENSIIIQPNVLDVGCGFGGLTVALSKLLPNHTILGLEIRAKVAEYVRLRIASLRHDNNNNNNSGQYQNCSVMRTNAMKCLPQFFRPKSLEKLFFCFPDPHFKRKNHGRRIISDKLLSEYAYLLKPTIGRLYLITDVEELHHWHLEKCRSHPLFRELKKEEERMVDVCINAMISETEEGKKVERAGSAKYYAVFERISDSEVVEVSQLVNQCNFFDHGEFGVCITTKEEEEKEGREEKQQQEMKTTVKTKEGESSSS